MLILTMRISSMHHLSVTVKPQAPMEDGLVALKMLLMLSSYLPGATMVALSKDHTFEAVELCFVNADGEATGCTE